MSKVFSKKNFYLLFLCVITLLVIIITPTFAKFSSNYVAGEDVVGLSLDFDVSITNIEEYDKVLAKANDFTLFNVEVNNISSNTVYYGIWYRLNNDNLTSSDIKVYRLDDSLYTTSGDLSGNTEKTISLVVVNNTNTNIKLDIGVISSGVSTSELEYLGGRKLVSGVYTINYMKKLFEGRENYLYYRSDTYREKIKNASFVDYIEADASKIVTSWDVSKKGDNSIVAWLENNTTTGYYDLYIGSKNEIYAESLNLLFDSLSGLENASFDNLNTSLTIDMCNVFWRCYSLTGLDLSSFDTSKVTDFTGIFYDCQGLVSLNISNWDTSNAIKMWCMFSGCQSLISLDLSSFDTSNVTNMGYMFQGCYSLISLDVSNFDTSNVTRMDSMFQACKSLTSLDLSNFDTSNVTKMPYMFYNSNNLSTTITIKNANVTDYGNMFYYAANVTGAQIIVNYTSATSTLVDNMIATKSTSSNVVKGSLVS